MQEVGKKYPRAGYGGSFKQWIRSTNPHPYNSWGNGSAMRVSACGYVANSVDEVIQLSVPSTSMNSLLIGRNADNLRALQFIVSTALPAKEAELTRVSVDIADYKRQRADRIAERAEEWIAKVRSSGESITLDLNPADRRIVHKVAQDYSDIETHSEGEGKERKIIISKK